MVAMWCMRLKPAGVSPPPRRALCKKCRQSAAGQTEVRRAGSMSGAEPSPLRAMRQAPPPLPPHHHAAVRKQRKRCSESAGGAPPRAKRRRRREDFVALSDGSLGFGKSKSLVHPLHSFSNGGWAERRFQARKLLLGASADDRDCANKLAAAFMTLAPAAGDGHECSAAIAFSLGRMRTKGLTINVNAGKLLPAAIARRAIPLLREAGVALELGGVWAPTVKDLHLLLAATGRYAEAEWAAAKVAVMREVAAAKARRFPHVEALLLGTGDARLVEMTATDRVWGVDAWGEGVGENLLGRIWMERRAAARAGGRGSL